MHLLSCLSSVGMSAMEKLCYTARGPSGSLAGRGWVPGTGNLSWWAHDLQELDICQSLVKQPVLFPEHQVCMCVSVWQLFPECYQLEEVHLSHS